jgi:glycosyltransferase involved in cell wall biosynthesis
MPIRNEAASIREVLDSVAEQDYPSDLVEVLVVDGMSTDGTRDEIEVAGRRFVGKGFVRFLLLDNPSGATPAALNAGITKAQGDIVVRVDGHCRIQPDYVSRCVDQLVSLPADNVGGGWISLGRSRTGRAIALATVSRFGVGGNSFRNSTRPGWAQTVYLGAYRRAVFESIGSFDEELIRNQDDELNLRLIQAGGRIWFDPSLRTEHYARETLSAHYRQHFEFGYYKVRVMQKRRTVPAWRHLVPAGFVSALAASVGLSIVTRRSVFVLSVAGPYALGNMTAACISARHEPRLIPRVAGAFALMHIGYGLGFLAGIWRWRRFFFSERV